MKFTTALCTLALATAQDGDGSQGADSQGAESQGADSGYGGEAQQESYGGEAQESYGAEAYAAPVASYGAVAVEAYRPKICVTRCPTHAPFFELASGQCVAGACRAEIPYQQQSYGEESYASEEPSYGAAATQQSGYRRLGESDNSYGYEAPAAEAPAQESYAAPAAEAYAAPEASCDQNAATGPRGSIDTRTNFVSSSGRFALWAGFIILFFSSVYFINRYLWFYYLADVSDGRKDFRIGSSGGEAIYTFLASPALICGMVTFIASLAYLAMATHHGFYIRCFDGREFYYARYLDWLITTPLMLHALATGLNMEDNIWHYMFFNDILMIVAGLIGSTIGTGEKWIFFGFSMLCFIPIIYYLCWAKNRVIDNRLFDGAGNPVDLAARTLVDFLADVSTAGAFIPSMFFQVGFNNVMRLTVAAWSMYPIVWILAEGTGTISANGEAIVYTVLDIISKAGFGFLISTMKKNRYQQLVAAGFRLLDGTNFDAAIDAAVTSRAITDSGSSSL